MYALPNKTQHKLIVKVRGGISQKLDNLTSSQNSSSPSSSSSSKSQASVLTTAAALEAATSTITKGQNSNSNLSSPLTTPFKTTHLTKEFNTKANNLDSDHFDLSCLPQPVFHSLNQHGNKHRSMSQRAQKQQYITPEHNEMIKYFQQSWKGVERDYKKSVNNFINNLDINSSDHPQPTSSHLKQKPVHAKKKTATTSTPLLLTGSYHHASTSAKDSASNRQDSFQPFDLEAFWGNRMFKRLTEES